MKKLCNVLFVVFIAIFAMTSCSQDSLLDDGEELNAVHGIELRGHELANNLLASFENYVTRGNDIVYPDYYGGMYLDDDGTLVVLSVSDDPNLYRDEFVKRCQGDNFKLQPCKSSLNELKDGVELIRKSSISQPSLFEELHLKSFWVSEKENKVYIGLSDCSSDNINRFKRFFGRLAFLDFEKIDNIEFQSEIDAGSPINSKFGASQSSLGYRAKYAGEQGFVVAAHAMITMGKVALGDSSSDEIGQIKIIDESVDAAFCALFSGFTASNMTYDFKTLTSNVATVIYGDNVSICGRYNTGSGSVISTNYNFVGPNGTPIWGAVQATYNSRSGDSGAVIYTTTGHDIAGMHSAGITANGVKTAVFIPASSINSKLSLTMY